MTAIEPFDSLARCAPGRWSHAGVTVERDGGPLRFARTPDGGLLVRHGLQPKELGERLVADITARVGSIGGRQDEFESVMVGLVLSTVPDPLDAWATYYRNSMADLLSGTADFAPIHQRAQELVTGSVLDMGSCFGFFPIRLAMAGVPVTATDIHLGTTRMIDAVVPRLGVDLPTITCTAADVPLPDRSVDTVTALHLLEHVDPQIGRAVVAEAIRLARRRVVIAVPFENEATACHGHVRIFDLGALDALGRDTGLPFRTSEYHGGWLILETADH
ncbi:mycofactocin oligosaccharide methyltransferase MftM [Millisia brevis]|uniref:mycofactocin oligosaccharide methyltransferase MftM n=1 Tax=Millisia brevis TaxID=264148 RepID=UPI000835899A|nr:mycofactocin oligosaccharide methyltransferase MftM [Millisia brevis]